MKRRVIYLRQDFLGTNGCRENCTDVDPRTYNDGYANSYKIISEDYTYVVQGTEQAKERILEIAAIKELRKKPAVLAAAETVKDKTENLIATPIRALRAGGNDMKTLTAPKPAKTN